MFSDDADSIVIVTGTYPDRINKVAYLSHSYSTRVARPPHSTCQDVDLDCGQGDVRLVNSV